MAKVQLTKRRKAKSVVQSTRTSKACFKQSEIKKEQPFESTREKNAASQENCVKSDEYDGGNTALLLEGNNVRKRVEGDKTEKSNNSSFTIDKAGNINTNITSTSISSTTTNHNNNHGKTEECLHDCKIDDKSLICDKNNITGTKCTDKELTLPPNSLNAQRVILTAKQATFVIAVDKERSEHVNYSLFPSLTTMLTCKGGESSWNDIINDYFSRKRMT